MAELTKQGKMALNALAINLQVPPGWLYNLIKFETASTFDPFVKNPYSSARGMIQFVNATARELGYRDSLDLVEKNPTQESQLLGPVYQYLKRYMPFDDKQSLYMAVFYPGYRNKPPSTEFPEHVQNVNPGIKTINDYVRRVEGGNLLASGAVTAAFFAAIAAIIYKYSIKK